MTLKKIIENKLILIKYTGLDIEQINNLPYYEFENYVKIIKNKNKNYGRRISKIG